MKAENFSTSFVVDQSPAEVYEGVINVRGWWSEEIAGRTDQLNAEFNYHFGDAHRTRIKITEMIPGRRVVWKILDNYFNFTEDSSEWTGDEIIFEINQKDNKTLLEFVQVGLTPVNECYTICRDAWTNYINKSLFNLVTKGKGQPNATGKPQTSNEARLGSSD